MSHTIDRYYGPLRLPPGTNPFPVNRLSDRLLRIAPQTGPGRASPVPDITFLPFHALYAGEFFGTDPESLSLPWPSPNGTGLGSPFIRSRRGRLRLMLRTGKLHGPKGRLSSRFGGGFSADAGDQLPGSLAITRTGLSPVGDAELTIQSKASPTFAQSTGHTPVRRGNLNDGRSTTQPASRNQMREGMGEPQTLDRKGQLTCVCLSGKKNHKRASLRRGVWRPHSPGLA